MEEYPKGTRVTIRKLMPTPASQAYGWGWLPIWGVLPEGAPGHKGIDYWGSADAALRSVWRRGYVLAGEGC